MLVGPAIEDPGAATDEEVGEEEEAYDERYEEQVEHVSTVPPALSNGGRPYGICTQIPVFYIEA